MLISSVSHAVISLLTSRCGRRARIAPSERGAQLSPKLNHASLAIAAVVIRLEYRPERRCPRTGNQSGEQNFSRLVIFHPISRSEEVMKVSRRPDQSNMD
jgi:hypothetical protein